MIEPLTIFGLNYLELLTLFIVTLIALPSFILSIYLYIKFRQPPYRVILKELGYSESKQSIWVLERRKGFIDEDWKVVFESENKKDVQIKAREALFAHYRFRDFVNQSDISSNQQSAET